VGVTYSERLAAPVSWWLLAFALVVSVWLALAVAVPGAAVWGVTAVAAAVTTGLLVGYGAVRITVGPEGVRVGRAFLDWAACGRIEALDADATRRLQRVDADARAYLVIRPYLRRAVRIGVTDPGDPTPYWLVSTRHPERLTAAVEDARPRT
jgi:hypothetical protein